MTITYTAEVATCRGLGCFWKLLFRWKGSIYKLLWPNFFLYTGVYFTLSCIYRFALSNNNRQIFEKIALHCQTYGDLIPIAFVLGFYVSIVIKRWWDQYICMPWPDNLAMYVSTLITGQDDRGRLMRRTIIRYVNLCLVYTLRMMSPRVKKRFPTMDHLVEAGFLQPNEKKIFEDLDQKTVHPKYWMPLVWAGGIITRARKEGRIKDDFSMKTLIDELNKFRGGCGGMLNYDWISIPLVYTQVVTLAVYFYFIASLMSNQFLDPSKGYAKHDVDLVVPVFTFLQFFFYMGWLKVAESLVNPFGEDDDDFELNWLVDRNLQVSYVIVDEMHQEHPEMVKDQYWDEVFPSELPYTAASKQYQTGPPPISTENIEVPFEQSEFMPMETIAETGPDDADDLADMEGLDTDIQNDGSRRETHPMKIQIRGKVGSGGSLNVSFSGPRTSNKNSVLNMLTKFFHRDESNRDIASSNLGSSISIHSRRGGLRSNSRTSNISQSQAQSKTSIFRENTFQDEMFQMSDESVAGSPDSTSSQIQIITHKDREAGSKQTFGEGTEEDHDPSETIQLIPGRKDSGNFKKTPKNKSTELRSIDLSAADEGSDNASSCSAKTSFCQDWPISNQSSVPETSISTPKMAESYNRGSRSMRGDWKDSAMGSPYISFMKPAADSSSSTTRVIIPSSPPIRHTFPPATPSMPNTWEPKRKLSEAKEDKGNNVQFGTSYLARSLQQKTSSDENTKSPAASTSDITFEIVSEVDATTNLFSRDKHKALETDFKLESEPVITILPPSLHFGIGAPAELVTAAFLTTSVSLPSALQTTTSIVNTCPSQSQPAVTFASSVAVSSNAQPSDPQKQTDNQTIETTENVEDIAIPPQISAETFKVDIDTDAASSGIPLYVPSAAIPVPSVSPARASNSMSMMETGFELMEAALVPLSRRPHHDFHDLEPISEHGEISADICVTTTDNQDSEVQQREPDTGGTASTAT